MSSIPDIGAEYPETPDPAQRRSRRRAPPDAEDSRMIGSIIQEARGLSAEDLQRISEHQRTRGIKFGESAIALGLATPDDVMHALSVQFNYPYARLEGGRVSPELVMLREPFGRQAESFRATRAQILMQQQGENAPARSRRALAVISPNSGDGKSFFCSNLAVSLAQMGARTVVVDADLRGPRLHDVFQVGNEHGLSTLLSGRSGENVLKPVQGVPNLFVLPAGVAPPNPLELLQGAAFGLLLHELLAKFEHVIVDTPAGEFGADGSVIATRCGSALVVVHQNQCRADELNELVGTLSSGTVRLMGVVMNEY